jgi:predicted phage tail protein
MTHVKLLGELGEKFGTDWECSGKSIREILKLIDCQVDGFKDYFAECHEKNIGFTLQNGNDFIEENEEAWLPTVKDTVIISPVPAGSGKGLGKILAAIFMITVIVMTGGAAATVASTSATGTGAMSFMGVNLGTATQVAATAEAAAFTTYSLSTAGYLMVAIGANLGIMGITEMTAPDAGDMTSDPSFLFNGADNNIEQGQPVPVLYGTMKIGGTPVSQGFQTGQLRGASLNYSSSSVSSTYYGGSNGTTTGGGSRRRKGATHQR